MPMLMLNVFCFMFAKMIWFQKDQLLELSIKDPLTGTGNRRALGESMEQLLGLRKRRDISAAMIAFDIDSFKDINDVYGHQSGDQILMTVTEVIRSRIRLTDKLYRQGGDEFVIAIRLAEELRRMIQNTIFSGGIRVTLSFGVAELHKDETQEEWLRNVDKALYNAKLAGRNTVCTSDSSESAFYSLLNHSSH
jgi:diguanylate cyclase